MALGVGECVCETLWPRSLRVCNCMCREWNAGMVWMNACLVEGNTCGKCHQQVRSAIIREAHQLSLLH